MMEIEGRWFMGFETWKPEDYEGAPDQKSGGVFSSDPTEPDSWTDMTVLADDSSQGKPPHR